MAIAETAVKLYRLGLDTNGDVEKTEEYIYDPTNDVEDFRVVNLGDLTTKLEAEENVFETDDIDLVVEKLPEGVFNDYSDLTFAPWIAQVSTRGEVWHGVVDPVSIRYSHDALRYTFDVLSYDYIWGETDVAARSKFDTEIVEQLSFDDNLGIVTIALPRLTEEGFDVWDDVLEPGGLFDGSGRGNVLVLDGQNREIRSMITQVTSIEANRVVVAAEPAVDTTIYDSADLGELEFESFSRRGNPSGTTAKVSYQSSRLTNVLLDANFPLRIVTTSDGGAGVSSTTWTLRERNVTINEIDNIVTLTRSGRAGLRGSEAYFSDPSFRMVIESIRQIDFEAGKDVSILSNIAYNTDTNEFSGLTSEYVARDLVDGMAATSPLLVLGEMYETASSIPVKFTVPVYAEFPENLRESLGLIARKFSMFYRFVPYLDGDGMPKYTVEFVKRREIDSDSTDVIPLDTVITAEEQGSPREISAVVVRANKDYLKPNNLDEVAGWYYELPDGTSIRDVEPATLSGYTAEEAAQIRRQRPVPSNADILEIDVVAVPSYDGAFWGSGGNATQNDTVLSEIAEEFYRFYRDFGRRISLTIKGEHHGLVGNYAQINEGGVERLIWVKETSVEIEGDRTHIEGRIGAFSAIEDLAPRPRIRGRTAHLTAFDEPLELTLFAEGQDPAGGALDFEWVINGTTFDPEDSDSLNGRTLRLSGDDRLSAGTYDIEVIATSENSGKSGSDTREIIITERDPEEGGGRFNDPFKLRKFKRVVGGEQRGVLRVTFFTDREDISEIEAIAVSGGEPAENDSFDLTIGNGVTEVTEAGDFPTFEIEVALHPIHTSTIRFEADVDTGFSLNPGTTVTFDTQDSPLITNEGFFIDGVGTGFLSARGDTDVDEMRWDTATTEADLATDPAGLPGVVGNRIDFEEVVENADEGERWFVRVFAVSNSVDDFDSITLSAVRSETTEIPNDPTFGEITIDNVGVFGGEQSSVFQLWDLTKTDSASLNVQNLNADGDLSIGGNTTLQGDLTVLGTEFIANTETVEISDNLGVINAGETGSGVTAGFAGWEVDRGTADNFRFGFEEDTELFKVGKLNALQAIATREDNPEANGISFWNSADNQFSTSPSLLWENSNLLIGDLLRVNAIDNRFEVWNPTEEIAAVGYLEGLPRNEDGTPWESGVYGFWAKEGDKIVIDGDVEYEDGDWIIEKDATFFIRTGLGDNIIALGTERTSLEKGLFLYDTDGNVQAKFTRDALELPDGSVTAAMIDVDNLFSQEIEVGNKLFATDAIKEVIRFGSDVTPDSPEVLQSVTSISDRQFDNTLANEWTTFGTFGDLTDSVSVIRLRLTADISNLDYQGELTVGISQNNSTINAQTNSFSKSDTSVTVEFFTSIANSDGLFWDAVVRLEKSDNFGAVVTTDGIEYEQTKPTYSFSKNGIIIRYNDIFSEIIAGAATGGASVSGIGSVSWNDLEERPFTTVDTNSILNISNNELTVGIISTGDVDFADQQLNTGSSPTFGGLAVNGGLDVSGDIVGVDGKVRAGIEGTATVLDIHSSDQVTLVQFFDGNDRKLSIGYENNNSRFVIRERTNGNRNFFVNDNGTVEIPNGSLEVDGNLDVNGFTIVRNGLRFGSRTDFATGSTNPIIYRAGGMSGTSLGDLVLQARSNLNGRGIVMVGEESPTILARFVAGGSSINTDLDVSGDIVGATLRSGEEIIIGHDGNTAGPPFRHEIASGGTFHGYLRQDARWNSGSPAIYKYWQGQGGSSGSNRWKEAWYDGSGYHTIEATSSDGFLFDTSGKFTGSLDVSGDIVGVDGKVRAGIQGTATVLDIHSSDQVTLVQFFDDNDRRLSIGYENNNSRFVIRERTNGNRNFFVNDNGTVEIPNGSLEVDGNLDVNGTVNLANPAAVDTGINAGAPISILGNLTGPLGISRPIIARGGGGASYPYDNFDHLIFEIRDDRDFTVVSNNGNVRFSQSASLLDVRTDFNVQGTITADEIIAPEV